MPLLGNQASSHPMSPATQVTLTDATATFGGTAQLSTVYPGYAQFTTAGDSVTLPVALLAGNSTISLSAVSAAVGGATPNQASSTKGRNATVQVLVVSGGVTTYSDVFTWRTGENSIYETYRVTGEYVTVIVTATETGAMGFGLNLYVMSV